MHIQKGGTPEIVPAVFQGLWVGKKFSLMEQLSISSFLKNGHSYHLYVYDEIEDAPAGTILKDARTVIPADRVFKNRRQDTYAGFSNLFRYRLLLEKGNYWVDTDVICLRPFQFDSEYAFTRVPRRNPSQLRGAPSHNIASWFIKACPGSKVMEYCYRQAEQTDPNELVWGQTGPDLLTEAVYRFNMQDYVVPKGTFCPIYWWQWERFIKNSLGATLKWKLTKNRSYGVHLYNEMWRRNQIDKDGIFQSGCIYERLKHRYLDAVRKRPFETDGSIR